MPSKFFKGMQKSKKVVPPVPRAMDEINKEYGDLIGKVGQAQYQAYAYTREVEKLNQQLLNVNLEAKARQELDMAAKTPDDTNKEVNSGEAV